MGNLHYNKAHCRIYYLTDLRCVHLIWDGYADSENFREACNFSLELLAAKKSDKMIIDNTMPKIIKPEDQIWMNKDWFPRAFALGFRNSAVVLTKSSFKSLSVKKIVNEFDKSLFTLQFFSACEDALRWVAELERKKQTSA